MTQWIEDPQGRLEVEKVTKEMKLPVWKANHKGKFRDFWNELWDKIEDYVLKLKGDPEKNSKGLNDRLVSAVGKHDGDFPISNAVVGNVYYSELTKKYYKCKIGGPAPMPNGNFIDLSILENLNRLENLYKIEYKDLKNNIDKIDQIPKTQKLTATDDYTFIDLYFVSNHDENINVFIGIYRVFKGFFANIKLEGQITRVETKDNEIIIKNTNNNIRCSWAVVYYINTKINSWT